MPDPTPSLRRSNCLPPIQRKPLCALTLISVSILALVGVLLKVYLHNNTAAISAPLGGAGAIIIALALYSICRRRPSISTSNKQSTSSSTPVSLPSASKSAPQTKLSLQETQQVYLPDGAAVNKLILVGKDITDDSLEIFLKKEKLLPEEGFFILVECGNYKKMISLEEGVLHKIKATQAGQDTFDLTFIAEKAARRHLAPSEESSILDRPEIYSLHNHPWAQNIVKVPDMKEHLLRKYLQEYDLSPQQREYVLIQQSDQLLMAYPTAGFLNFSPLLKYPSMRSAWETSQCSQNFNTIKNNFNLRAKELDERWKNGEAQQKEDAYIAALHIPPKIQITDNQELLILEIPSPLMMCDYLRFHKKYAPAEGEYILLRGNEGSNLMIYKIPNSDDFKLALPEEREGFKEKYKLQAKKLPVEEGHQPSPPVIPPATQQAQERSTPTSTPQVQQEPKPSSPSQGNASRKSSSSSDHGDTVRPVSSNTEETKTSTPKPLEPSQTQANESPSSEEIWKNIVIKQDVVTLPNIKQNVVRLTLSGGPEKGLRDQLPEFLQFKKIMPLEGQYLLVRDHGIPKLVATYGGRQRNINVKRANDFLVLKAVEEVISSNVPEAIPMVLK